jgi:hypothetical protein
MPWIIRNVETNKYVSPSGSEKSYTTDPTKARRFDTKEQAEADACSNERAVDLMALLNL